MSEYKTGLFHLDGIDEEYEGITKGATWNGWDCPWFTKETAERILLNGSRSGDLVVANYDYKNDRFAVAFDDRMTEDDTEYFKGVDIDGVTYYPIGAGSWTWREVESAPTRKQRELMKRISDAMFILANEAESNTDFNDWISEQNRHRGNIPVTHSLDELALEWQKMSEGGEV